ncbi:MAG: AAA family ATPase [Hyphomicrobiaceae bacterium]|nr:AAA family ATPase [Hyphomicrobiaceae bacterium]MCC0010949.1 AAA family ATPase [Hyphomicrobiaceae bacterium]
MIFKYLQRDKPDKAAKDKRRSGDQVDDGASAAPREETEGSSATPQNSGSHGSKDVVNPLDAAELRRVVDPASLGFGSTAELAAASGLIGQERALEALAFGTDMKALDFNVFVLGPPAAGKSTAVRSFLAERATALPTPDDWVYVNNFETPNRPRALRLPPGRARPFAKAVLAALDELSATVPAVFESEDYQTRHRAIDEEFRAQADDAFAVLSTKAEEQNVAILKTPTGFVMAPMHDGEVVKPETFSTLPESYRQDVAQRIEGLQKDLEEILARAPRSEKARRKRLAELNEEVAQSAVANAVDDVRDRHRDLPQVLDHLDQLETDLVHSVGLFLARPDEDDVVRQPLDTARDARFRRYLVNVIIGHHEADGTAEAGGEFAPAGAPVYEELNPTYPNVLGRIEHLAQMGALVTDFLLVFAGALHRANGGFLLMDARKLLTFPFAWEALKRALKSGSIRIEQPSETHGVLATQTLEPEPIPLDVKVILFGDREIYYMLAAVDPDFSRLFKVQADFDNSIERTDDNDQAFARLMAAIVERHGLKAVTASGVARLIEEAARLADDRDKISIEVGHIADLLREADYWAGRSGRKEVEAEDIARAVDSRIQRADRLRDRAQESIQRNIVMIDTQGAKIGQVNGLSVLQLGGFSFGKPSRISARVRFGSGRVVDIEREAKLGGPLHSKGVMILWGFLAGRYVLDQPLALAASLVFEQSYGGVEGDSASSAELYALLSALADVPIDQGLAVTGSVNQWGEVQAIGGVNEKIEGFFDTCAARGLTGDQGVLVPAANVQHLMVRDDVVRAVRAGQFSVYPVKSIDEGIALLTGLPAGERGEDGLFPEGSLNRLVEDKLGAYASRIKSLPGGFGDGVDRAGAAGAGGGRGATS